MADSDHSPDTENGWAPTLLRRLTQALRGGGARSIRESLEEVIEESERQSPSLTAEERVMLANLLRLASSGSTT